MDNRIQYPFKNDHEVFIALIEDFNISVSQISKQMVDDRRETGEIKELLQKQYNSLSERIRNVEDDLLHIKPEEIGQIKKELEAQKKWQANFNKRKHIAWVVASSGFYLIGSVTPEIIHGFVTLFVHHK